MVRRTLLWGLVAIVTVVLGVTSLHRFGMLRSSAIDQRPQEWSLPVRGKDSHGVMYQGQSTYRSSGRGDFWVENLDGLRCEGLYDAASKEPTIKAEFTCSDQRHGNVIISRASNLQQGYAIAKFDDGTTGQLLFGDQATWGWVVPNP